MKPVGVILAGGLSKRFGSDKATALFLGRPLLAHVAEVLGGVCEELLIVAAAGQEIPALEQRHRVLRDPEPERGPAVALAAAFEALSDGVAVVAPTDVPLLAASALERLLGALGTADAAVPVVGGHRQHLAAAYRVQPARTAFRREATEGRGSVHGALSRLTVREVDEAAFSARELDGFQNLNTPALLARAEQAARDGMADDRAVDTPAGHGQDRA